MTERPEQPDQAAAEEPEWWDDPALPWKQKPTRADVVCLSALGVAGVYGLIMLPLRPIMLGLAPHLLGSLGYRTGLVMTGALASLGDVWWPLVLIFGSLMTMKFDWIYWWAGKLWGRNIMDVWASGKSARTQKRYDKVWRFAHKYETPAIFLAFLPIPLPRGILFAALGAAGTKLWKFLTVCGLSALITSAGYMALGYWIGEPAVEVIDTYGRYLWYVSIAIIVGMLGAYWLKQRKAPSAPEDGDEKV